MQGDILLTFLLVIFILGGVCSWVELGLSATWNPAYFTKGLPLFVIQTEVEAYHTNLPPVERLEIQFRSPLFGSVVFHEVALDTYGFRTKLLEFHLNISNMPHGMLYFDRQNHRVVLTAFASLGVLWLALIFLALFVAMLISPTLQPWWQGVLPLVCIVLIFIVAPILIAFNRCRKLASYAASAWTRTYPTNLLAIDDP